MASAQASEDAREGAVGAGVGHTVGEGDAVAADGVIWAAQQRHHVGFDPAGDGHAGGREIAEAAGEAGFEHYLEYVFFDAEALRGGGVRHRHALETAQIRVIDPGPGGVGERTGEEGAHRFEQAGTEFGVGEPLKQGVYAALVEFAGEEVAGHGGGRGVGVGFERDIDAVALGFVDLGHQLRDPAGVIGMSAVVGDVNRYAGASADFEGFGDARAAGGAIVVMVADMYDIDAAMRGDGPVERDQFFGIAVGVGVVGEAGGEAERALLNALGDQPLRLGERVADERHIAEADAGEADRSVRREHGDIAALALVMLAHRGDAGHIKIGRRRAE